jgi:predicted O-methyltransferase YrrM
MSLKRTIKKLIPSFITKRLLLNRAAEQQKKFEKLKTMPCNTSNLLESKEVILENIFKNDEAINSWNEWQNKLESFAIPDFTGGVNPGDIKAIFFLIRFFKPKSVLEIGTHIGASTVNIASALKLNHTEFNIKPTFRTLDIRNVNSTSEKPWLNFGTEHSPLDMIKKIQCESFVEFITDTSINYFENTSDNYDFIFLDGDHSATFVYQEIPLALNKINKGGVILLHDYFPNGKPLWSNDSIIDGPYLATERLIREGANIVIIPLGALPWSTKLNSNITSLALCLKK